jgi:hypothetical protein
MKNILFLILLISSLSVHAQTYTNDDKSLTGVFKVAGKSKAEIFSAINKWISINYNSGKSVTQLSDVDGGNIIVKGINEIVYKNTYKHLFPNNNFYPQYFLMKLNHLIEVNVKDNKFRIIYRIVDYVPENTSSPYNLDKFAFDCINFNGASKTSIFAFNKKMTSLLRTDLIGLKKRKSVLRLTKPAFDEARLSLIVDMKLTMELIRKSITTPTDDW